MSTRKPLYDGERQADEVDAAQMMQDRLNADALQSVRDNLQEAPAPNFDGKTCVECAEDIPQARLALGKVRCVLCQETIENRSKLWR